MESFSSEKKMDMKDNFVFMYDDDAYHTIPYQNVDTGVFKISWYQLHKKWKFPHKKVKGCSFGEVERDPATHNIEFC